MRNLFLKIFFWFWAAALLMIGGVLLVTLLITRLSGEQRPGNPFNVFANEAARIYEREGPSGLQEYLKYLDEQFRRPSFLLDLTGKELAGRTAPAPVLKEIQELREQKADEPPAPRSKYLIQPVNSPSGQRYVFVTEMPQSGSERLLDSALGPPLVGLIVLLTTGLACYALARHLTAPIAQLREANRRLAEGDLSVRVADTITTKRGEVKELGLEFDRMAAQIEALITGQQRLLGDISHELRSPLTRLYLALGVARRQAGEAAAKSHDRIEQEAERLNELIGQLLTLTELESGGQQIRFETFNLAETINNIAADADFEARNLKRAVIVLTAEDCTISGDEMLLHRAIENVVRNAIRYTAEGTAVEISLTAQSQHSTLPIVVIVRDHGPGVPAEALPQLFQPFYRVDAARDRQSGGAGLGLSITERAIRLHGGCVEASNAPDGGLMIQIHLPARAPVT